MSLSSLKETFKQRMLAQPTITKQTIKVEDDRELPTKLLYQPIQVPISRRLFEIIDCLKQEPLPVTNNDIIRKTTIDILGSPELFEAVLKNDRIQYNTEDQTFEFKPNYKIRTRQDLIDLLRRNRGVMGMEVTQMDLPISKVLHLLVFSSLHCRWSLWLGLFSVV